MTNGSVDRRKMLLGGAAIGTAAWVAPQIHSVATAGPLCSASGCTPTVVNLLAAPFTVGGGSNLTTGSYVVNGTTLTATRTNTNSTNAMSGVNCGTGATQTGITGVAVNTRFGNIPTTNAGARTGQIPMVVTASNASVAMTLNFNPGVRKLSFTLTDIDSVAGNYQEQVVISWTNGSGDAAPTYTPGAQVSQTLPIGPATANTYQATTDNFNAPCDSAASNLAVQFDNCGTITSLTITSNDLITAAGGTTRVIGIALLSWCV